MVNPCISQILFESARPSPVPAPDALDSSPVTNGSKIWSHKGDGISSPESATKILTSSAVDTESEVTDTLIFVPSGLCRIAFVMRFVITRESWILSALMNIGRSGISTSISSPAASMSVKLSAQHDLTSSQISIRAFFIVKPSLSSFT